MYGIGEYWYGGVVDDITRDAALQEVGQPLSAVGKQGHQVSLNFTGVAENPVLFRIIVDNGCMVVFQWLLPEKLLQALLNLKSGGVVQRSIHVHQVKLEPI